MGREFVGIEGYPGIDFVETFSKPELEQMLQENGFSKFKFYYPYPDYKFPAVIYSDEYLPKPGELRKISGILMLTGSHFLTKAKHLTES